MKNALSIENKILLKIDNEIITSIDVEKEYRYLAALNKNFKDLDKKEIFEISKKSIINEKIKIIEINKSFKNPSIKEEYLELVISNIYKRIGLNDLKSFKEYLKNVNVKYLDVKKKIEIESLWNELIIAKFSSKININVNEIKKDIINNKKNISKSYLLSEIFFEVQNSNEINTTYEKIKDTILKKGFENAAITFSLSSTASQGGNLGWIEEDSVNKNLREVLSRLKINDITNPITVPGGFIILKINEIKEVKKNQNIENEIKRIIKLKKNNQLNQFSKIYFNKIKRNIKINEI
jgi:peptidyl-prolyl cis-trans isomerase SurA